jgi:capsular polysaccharide biosynthesis protein
VGRSPEVHTITLISGTSAVSTQCSTLATLAPSSSAEFAGRDAVSSDEEHRRRRRPDSPDSVGRVGAARSRVELQRVRRTRIRTSSMTTTADATPATTTVSETAPRPAFSLWDVISLPSTRNAAIAMALAAGFAVLAAMLVLASAPTYQSRATLAIDQPRAVQDSPDTGIIDKLDRLRLKYAGLADTAPVLDPIARDLDVDLGDLRDDTTIVIGPQSLLMFPTATAGDERDAERRAQALADAIAEYADAEQARNGIAAAERYRFTVIENASDADKVSPTSRSAVAAAALAAILGVAIAYVVLQVATADRRLS